MDMSSSTIRVVRNEILEEYEPMTSLYWKKKKKPNIDLRVSPFAVDRQLEDQKWSILNNRNPRGSELAKGQKLRSETFVKRREPTALATKAKVVNKIVREVSGVHTFTLVPPIEKRDKRIKEEVDPDTHPLMKPYRDESSRNPIMCSFGHRPSSASRTFHPSTMNVRLGHEQIAAVADNGQSGFGLQPAILAKLLHAPQLDGQKSEEDSKSRASTRPPTDWEDPHNLFISEGDLMSKTVDTHSLSEKDEGRQFGGNLEHSKSWNAASYSQWEGANDTTSFVQSSSRRKKHKKSKKNMRNSNSSLDPSGWNNHFHVIERHANETFELKKSGIAELKLMPLKDRLSRFASLAVRESRPNPFCAEKKSTDALLLAGKDAPPRERFNLKENPYYDAEVNEDVRIIQLNHEIELERKRKELNRKKFKVALKSIPHCDYHPDQSVQSQHLIDEENAMEKSDKALSKEKEFQSVGDLYNKFSLPKPDAGEKHAAKKKVYKKKGDPKKEKIRFFAHTYLGQDEMDNDAIMGNTGMKKKKISQPKYNIDKVFDHVMQPFEEYLKFSEDENEDDDEEEDELNKECDATENNTVEEGTDITKLLQQREEEGKKIGFREEDYDYSAMREVVECQDENDENNVECYDEGLLESQEDVDGPIHPALELEDEDPVEEEELIEKQLHVEKADILEKSGDVNASHSVLHAGEMFESSFVNQQYHDTVSKINEGRNEDDQVRKERVLDASTSHSVLQTDDMFQNSFIEQNNTPLEKEDYEKMQPENSGMETVEEDGMNERPSSEGENRKVQAEQEVTGIEKCDDDDILDNPSIQEQPLFDNDEENGAGVEEGQYDAVYEEQSDDEGDVVHESVDDERENYDDGNLDFANEELDEDGILAKEEHEEH